MRIMHFSTGRTFRGGERQVEWLHEGLLRRGHDSHLICRRGSALGDQNIDATTAIPWAGQSDISGLVRLIMCMMTRKPQVLHCHDAHAVFHGAIAGRLLGTPVVAARRVVVPVGDNRISRWKYRASARIIAVSSAVAALLKPVADERKIRIVHDGVDAEITMSSRQDACKELGIKPDRLVIGTVGHFTEEKNIRLVAHLADALVTTRPNVQVVCVGPMQPDVDTLLRKNPNMRTTGRIHQPAHIYRAFDLYVSTSRHEGLGTALLDAIVRDIPVVATDAGGTRDLFPERYPLVSPDDVDGFVTAVITAVDDLENRRVLAGVLGRHAREKFSVDDMVEGTLDVYREMVKDE